MAQGWHDLGPFPGRFLSPTWGEIRVAGPPRAHEPGRVETAPADEVMADDEGAAAAKRARRRTVLLHVAGGLLVLLALAGGAVAWFAWTFSFSYCRDEPPGAVEDMRRSGAVIAVVWASIPAAWALLCARLHRSWQPYAIVAIWFAGLGLAVSATATPSQWCLF